MPLSKDEINKMLAAALNTLAQMQIVGGQAKHMAIAQTYIENAMQKLNEKEENPDG